VIDRFDQRGSRPGPAGLDHGFDRVVLANEDGLHRTVAAIADPAFKAVR
jgi:hypothetical protein